MDREKLARQITDAICNVLATPFSAILWLIGTIAIVSVACTVAAPILPSIIKPAGDVQKWIYIAGFVWLMKGAGR